ncbi:MAG: Hpt domain-containing protein [Pseudobacteriovorax sp.]|nr:Hpt domain-containing protein [Pseudobacteriovorax sp.]
MGFIVRDIDKDIENGKFVLFFPLALLTLFLRKLRLSKPGRSLKEYFAAYFMSSGNFNDGLFRFAFLCMYIFPICGFGFYGTLAYLTSDVVLAINYVISFTVMWGLAIYSSLIEKRIDSNLKLKLAWGLGFATIASVGLVGFSSKAAAEFHIEIWLYMVLVGFTIVQTFTLGISNAVLAASLPFLFAWRHEGEINFGCFLQAFGLLGSYLLASCCKLVSDTYAKKSERNEALAIKRETEISFLLNSIPQGIITLDGEGKIQPNYSEHTKDILNSCSLDGRTIKEVLLDHSNFNTDKKDQVWQSILAILGQDDINFYANGDKLVTEMTHNEKTLKLTWTPKIEDDLVGGILVTMLDITDEVKNAESLEQERFRVDMIFEIISSNNTDKVIQLLDKADSQVTEVIESLEKPLNEEESTEIVIVLHTLKGAARTLGLAGLASKIHTTEKEVIDYKGLEKESECPNSKILSGPLNELASTVNDYKSTFHSTVGNDVYTEIEWLNKTYRIKQQQVKYIISEFQKSNHDAFTQVFAKQIQENNQVDLKAFLGRYKSSLISIANAAQKPVPTLKISSDSIKIDSLISEKLEDIMIHLLNNHVSHSIETESIRLKDGKSAAGTIQIEAYRSNEYLIMKIWDDGRGINIKKIKEKLGPNFADASNLDVANQIFSNGLSTAESVSQISGRGVGMGAIKKTLSSIDGRITIIPTNDSQKDWLEFQFEIALPLNEIIHQVA